MQTEFSAAQLADPAMASSEAAIRKCVHCGFCNATCPTYALLGDELDGPRGRIYLMKEMLETEAAPTPQVVKHVDRCLSCLSCMTTCPSGVNYMRLVDHARTYIETRYRRPLTERLLRRLLAWMMPHPHRIRPALRIARVARPMRPILAAIPALRPVAAMLALAPAREAERPSSAYAPAAQSRGRVALLKGCAEPVLRPEIRAATVRLLNRAGHDVLFAEGETCCGALTHHMGREQDSLASVRRNVDAWTREIEGRGLDAIIVTASGCGTMIKDYGHLLRNDPTYAEKAARVSALAKDVSELLDMAELPLGHAPGLTVAYQPPCSLQHGQGVTEAPKRLLSRAGFEVRTPVEAHLCCGSAGTYNILQPELAGRLGERKAANIARLEADVIVTGNIGCAVQIGQHASAPVLHIVELLDWAAGGPMPEALADRADIGKHGVK
ncbi:glycolate oxidase iron-sulfur subunit [Sphingomonas oleivorans]|uniref:Glycolate oxidase iron-sulfur subunit n=1 Tax=Sphingomonas oleivorans TaxID=1735121 RepID=A0A2T5FYI9_9SPHN|nr:glycolate oxidase subunit GlcF [Sphingomonas oleivorans]PTQ11582.1 glycolate oxidase iron-sulfur subunit [Sphingomonas oleivorans]